MTFLQTERLTLRDYVASDWRDIVRLHTDPDVVRYLVDAVPTSANVEYHAKIVREKAKIRRLIETSTEIVSEAFEGRSTSMEMLDRAEQRILGQPPPLHRADAPRLCRERERRVPDT